MRESHTNIPVAKQVDAPHSKCGPVRGAGSIPAGGTTKILIMGEQINLDIPQIVAENKRLRGEIHKNELLAYNSRLRADSEKNKRVRVEYELERVKKELSELKKELPNIESEAGKIRMNAYNQAKQWNESVSKKFDLMIEQAKKGNVFERLIGWRIWSKMKTHWDSQKIKKQYKPINRRYKDVH